MSRDASITLPWADGDHTFRLGWGELEALQEAVDAGPYEILDRLHDRSFRIGHISHTIRLGLVGGGLKPGEALKLVRTYVEARPPAENLMLAIAVLSAGCVGAPDEKPGEGEAPNLEGRDLIASQTESSDLAPSTETER